MLSSSMPKVNILILPNVPFSFVSFLSSFVILQDRKRMFECFFCLKVFLLRFFLSLIFCFFSSFFICQLIVCVPIVKRYLNAVWLSVFCQSIASTFLFDLFSVLQSRCWILQEINFKFNQFCIAKNSDWMRIFFFNTYWIRGCVQIFLYRKKTFVYFLFIFQTPPSPSKFRV